MIRIGLAKQATALAVSLLGYKPGKNLAHYALRLAEWTHYFEEKLAGTDDPEELRNYCLWLMRLLIRAGFELVMERAGCYTHDLYPSYSTFIRYYPQHQKAMRQALEWAINPVEDKTEPLSFSHTFGRWLADEAQQIYG